MRVFDPEVVDTVWAAIGPCSAPSGHPSTGLSSHRASERVCFEVMLVRLVTGCSFEDADTSAATRHRHHRPVRRDELVEAGVFDRIAEEAICAYDKIIGLDLSEVAVDGSIHKARGGGEGMVRPTDRGRPGWKWSIATAAAGIPVGWTSAGAQRHDSVLLEPTLRALGDRGLLEDVQTVHLDRGYDWPSPGTGSCDSASPTPSSASVARPGQPRRSGRPLGLRWPVERTYSWLSNFGQLRRNSDRNLHHRLAHSPGNRLPHHCQADRLEEPLVPGFGPYPLILLASCRFVRRARRQHQPAVHRATTHHRYLDSGGVDKLVGLCRSTRTRTPP